MGSLAPRLVGVFFYVKVILSLAPWLSQKSKWVFLDPVLLKNCTILIVKYPIFDPWNIIFDGVKAQVLLTFQGQSFHQGSPPIAQAPILQGCRDMPRLCCGPHGWTRRRAAMITRRSARRNRCRGSPACGCRAVGPWVTCWVHPRSSEFFWFFIHGKHTKNDGTSPFLIGKSTINHHFQ